VAPWLPWLGCGALGVAAASFFIIFLRTAGAPPQEKPPARSTPRGQYR
jgi:hypothetical protein